jgi:hypothetical protein
MMSKTFETAPVESGSWAGIVSPDSGALTIASVDNETYTKVGRLVTLNFNILITTNGTGAGYIKVGGSPFSVAGSISFHGSGREIAVGGKMLLVEANGPNDQLRIRNYDNSYPGSDGANLNCTVTYETNG